jgi:hypothetical protein
MTLGELALVVGTSPKWILNAEASLGRDLPYTLATARRLSVARELRTAYGIPLPRAFALAGKAILQYGAGVNPVVLAADPESPVGLTIDVERILSTVHTRLAQVRAMHAPRQRGRTAGRARDPLAAARAYGMDVTLLAANQRQSPGERLKQLDAMRDFRRNVRRVSES